MKTVTGLIGAIILYISIAYINQWFSINLIARERGCPPLYDMLHQILPKVPNYFADYLILILVIYFFIRWGLKDEIILEHFLIIMSLIFIIRLFAFTLTRDPPSVTDRENECEFRQPGEPYKWIFLYNGKGCSDYLFSGHTAHMVLIFLFTLYYSNLLCEKVIIGILMVIELFFIIASRIHYSADVVIGATITILFFYAWQHIALNFLG